MNTVERIVNQHQEFFAFLVLAFIATMPEEPPANLRALPAWLYGWMHGGLKQFLNYRTGSSSTK